ncbi:GNT-I family-domain-containing protein [Scenedesmus sp. NREL 46B-D3]|nr:GNT-I family-domain-containing protein [Scenedesmus sp. NREL 46B-D3]
MNTTCLQMRTLKSSCRLRPLSLHKLPQLVLAALCLLLLLVTLNSSWHPRNSRDPRDAMWVNKTDLAHVSSEGTAVCNPGIATGLQLNTADPDLLSPVVVVAHNRVSYLAQTMMVLLRTWSAEPANARKFPLFISVDGGDQRTLLFASAWREPAGVQVISRVRDLVKCDHYDCHISLHFKYLLQLFFECHKSPRLIFVEEDLAIAPDFFSYMEAGSVLMDEDDSIWCISAWNDHGQIGRASDATALYRTDVMPGLGWMTNARQGLDLAMKWPTRMWDDWMRMKRVRRGRQCVFPEVPRTHTFGKFGSHSGEFYDNHLSKMILNEQLIDWSKQDLQYLLKDRYEQLMVRWLARAKHYSSVTNVQGLPLGQYCNTTGPNDAAAAGDMVVEYQGTHGTELSYMNISQLLPPMLGDLREGSPRGSYDGIVMVRCRGRRLFLKPAS